MLKNTGIMCMITVDDNSVDGIKHIDLGNYYIDEQGNRCIVIKREIAKKYLKYIDCDIYIIKEKERKTDAVFTEN